MVKTKRPRWEQNEISPSKYRSPTRYAPSDKYPDKDESIWCMRGSGLTNDQIEVYYRCTAHLHRDISLALLQELDYDIPEAVAACNTIEELPKLSLLEEKVLLASAPIPAVSLGIKSKSATQAERHVCSMLPHVDKKVIRDYFNKIGRDGFVPPRGWVPKVGHLTMPAAERLIDAHCFTIDEDSPLYEKPGKRVLRSSTITPEMNAVPRKCGKRDNLAIAMVGYDQNKCGEGDSSPEGRVRRSLPFIQNVVRSTSVEPRTSYERKSRSAQPRRMDTQTPLVSNGIAKKRGRPPLVRSPLSPSSRPTSPSQIPSSTSSSVYSTPTNGPKKRRNTLEIDMNWSPIENGGRMRRASTVTIENGEDGEDSPFLRKHRRDQDGSANGFLSPSSSRMPAGSDRSRRVRESSVALSDRSTRSSSVFGISVTPQADTNGNKYQRSKLHIDMVGWGQQSPSGGPKDRDGFAMPLLPMSRSAHKSPTRSRQPSLSPPASPEI